MSPGYQIAQTAHGVAAFAFSRPLEFQLWHERSQFVIALEASDLQKLEALYSEASATLDVIPFREPDLENALTSLAFVPHEANRRYLSRLPLAGKRFGGVSKHAPRGDTNE